MILTQSEEETRNAGASLIQELAPGDVVFLEGPLGAGKTTLVRGVLEALGHRGPVRSPTFNLLQSFATSPPVLHADLYRVAGWEGLGLEDYLDSHVLFVEWPDRAVGLIPVEEAWKVDLDFAEGGRRITIRPPAVRS